MTGRKRARHAAGRARKLTAGLSVLAFVGIGQAINVASQASTTAGTAAQAVGSSLPPTSQRSATVSAASRTTGTKAVTTTHAS